MVGLVVGVAVIGIVPRMAGTSMGGRWGAGRAPGGDVGGPTDTFEGATVTVTGESNVGTCRVGVPYHHDRIGGPIKGSRT